MTMDNRDDEIITVNIPRRDYRILRDMIERERTYSWFKNWVRTLWVWALAGGVLALIALNEKLSGMIR